MSGHGEKLTRKHELAIAALLECPTVEDAARKITGPAPIQGQLRFDE